MPRQKPPPPSSRRPTALGAGEGDVPSLNELERFTQSSLHQWLAAGQHLHQLHSALFFGLEQDRQRQAQLLIEALQSRLIAGYPIQGWSRIVDYRYTLRPLSVAGSIKGDGGRFNIGAGLNVSSFSSFPALYVAQDYLTAFKEKFGSDVEATPDELTPLELALRRSRSFTHVALRGQIELVLDVGAPETLEPFVKLLRSFVLPSSVSTLARQLGLRRPIGLIRSVKGLQKQLLHPHWRMMPAQFDLPSNSQIFGRMAAAAGVHGILYPSSKNDEKQCLALFPQNWKGSSSFVEVTGPAPEGATMTRIDGTAGELR